MRLLVAVGERCDTLAVSDYVAARFDRSAVEVDILSVVPRPRSPVDRLYIAGRTTAERRTANERVAALAARLDEVHGFRLVRKHVQDGVPAEVIVAAGERWRSGALLLGAPREPDLLTALGIDSVAHAVATRAQGPVELLRTASIDRDEGNRVLAVLDDDRLDDFPFDQLQLHALSWKHGSLLRILAVTPPARGIPRAWGTTSAARRKQSENLERRRWATARLDAVCRALTESCEGRVEIDHRLAEGATRDVARASAERLSASLLVLDGVAIDDARRGLISSFSRAAVALTAPCSVLLLRAGAASRRSVGIRRGHT